MEPISTTLLVGGSLITGILNGLSTWDANKKNLSLAKLQREDTLKANAQALKLQKEGLALNREQFDFTKSEAEKNRAMAFEQQGYGRAMSSFERGAALLSQALSLNQAHAAPFQKYAGGR